MPHAVSYPETDHRGEDLLQRLIMELLRPMLARFLAENGKVACVGADQFIYYRKGDPSARIAPDVYVLPGVSPDRRIRSWKVWEENLAPSFCFEVVSEDVRYDYEEKPILYSELGTRELVVFDPESEGQLGRYRWQVFRRLKDRGLIRVEVSQTDRVRSRELGVWLRQVGEGPGARVLPAVGKHGDVLVPTAEQREAHERAEEEHARREVDQLRAEIARLQRARPCGTSQSELASRVTRAGLGPWPMPVKTATEVAKRSLCLELLLQRLGLELDEEDTVAELDAVRRAWVSRLGQLGLEEAILPDERALLDRPVGELTDDECDDLEGRVIGALVLLWALLRLGARPTAASLGIATRLIAEHGVLGDGSIPEAKAAIEKLTLRSEGELRDGLAAYALAHERGAPTEPDPMVAIIGVRTLDWVLGEA